MFRWARKSELESDLFTSFLHRNSCLDLENENMSELWSYAWAYLSYKRHLAEHILIINSPSFYNYLKYEVNVELLDHTNSPHQTEALYDIVYSFDYVNRLNKLEYENHVRLISDLLKPGGKLIMLEPYNLTVEAPYKFSFILENSAFTLYKPNKYDLLPDHARMNQVIQEEKNDLIITVDTMNEHFLYTGGIFFKPFKVSDIEKKTFKVNENWLHKAYNEILPVEYIGGYNDEFNIYQGINTRIFWLPDALIQKKEIDIWDIAESIGTDPFDSTMLINELLCLGYLIDN
ncbi:hypothetical protein [Paenibacillus sp. FSL R7-0272]|uniref:hypothetical protein n=1 Tax=Paenibacillus sp. FSL R7-0272 TaxID=2921679 RepID=UPI0030EEBC87